MKHRVHVTIIVIVSLCLSLVGAEVLLRLFGPNIFSLMDMVQSVEDPRYYSLKPGITIRHTGLHEKLPSPVVWQINAQSMRSDRPVPLQSKLYRIMVYGDSEVFGMSVQIKHTIAKQMEVLDSRIEALNLGVFGYNARQVAEHVARTAARYNPDLLIYVVNENDTFDAIKPMTIVHMSRILQAIYFIYRVFHVEPEQHRLRYSHDRLVALRRELDRVATWGVTHDVPVVFVLFKWEIRPEQFVEITKRYAPSNPKKTKFRLITMDLDRAIAGEKNMDRHLTPSGYQKIATALCEAISGSVSSGCILPGP